MSKENKFKPPELDVKPINNNGELRIQFNEPMEFPSSWVVDQSRKLSVETIKEYIEIKMDATDKS